MTKRKLKNDVCPRCGSKSYTYSEEAKYFKCNRCGFVWDDSFKINQSAIINESNKRTILNDDEEGLSREDSEGDGLMGGAGIMFPPEDFDEE